MENISWTDSVRNGDVLQCQGGEEYSTDRKMKDGEMISHTLRRSCRIKHVIECKIKEKTRKKHLLMNFRKGKDVVN